MSHSDADLPLCGSAQLQQCANTCLLSPFHIPKPETLNPKRMRLTRPELPPGGAGQLVLLKRKAIDSRNVRSVRVEPIQRRVDQPGDSGFRV